MLFGILVSRENANNVRVNLFYSTSLSDIIFFHVLISCKDFCGGGTVIERDMLTWMHVTEKFMLLFTVPTSISVPYTVTLSYDNLLL